MCATRSPRGPGGGPRTRHVTRRWRAGAQREPVVPVSAATGRAPHCPEAGSKASTTPMPAPPPQSGGGVCDYRLVDALTFHGRAFSRRNERLLGAHWVFHGVCDGGLRWWTKRWPRARGALAEGPTHRLWLSHTSVRGDTASAPTEGGFPQERFAPSVILWTEAGAGPYRRGLCPSARGGPDGPGGGRPRPPLPDPRDAPAQRRPPGGPATQWQTTGVLTAAMLVYALGAGITAAAGTRLALQLILITVFGLHPFQVPLA